MVTEVDWTELGTNVDVTTVLEPEYEVVTEDDWVELGIDWETLGNDWEELGNLPETVVDTREYSSTYWFDMIMSAGKLA